MTSQKSLLLVVMVGMMELLYSTLSNHLVCILLGAPILHNAHTTLLLSTILAVVMGVDPETIYYDMREGIMGVVDRGGYDVSLSSSSADVRSRGNKSEPPSSNNNSVQLPSPHDIIRPRDRDSSISSSSRRYNPKGRLLGPIHRIAIVLAVMVGSFASPLDWEVWWQLWPVPSACLGAGVALLCCIHIAVQ